MTIRHLVLPDVQSKPNTDFSFLTAIGNYAAAKLPDVIVCIGDFADMPSLSHWDKNKKEFEGRAYTKDIEAATDAMRAFMTPIQAEIDRRKYQKKKSWNPRFILTLGNHEDRISRAISEDRKLDGLISLDDLPYKSFGWEVYPFLEVVVAHGVAYSHYFTSGIMGRPITSAQALLTKKHMSCFAGHQQGRQIAYARRADGKEMTAIICGSCYEHDEGYLGPQGNQHFRGFYVLNEVDDGRFDETAVSLRYVKENYL